MSTPTKTILPEAEIDKRGREWSQAEYGRAMRHLLNLGFIDIRVFQPSSGVLPPLVAIWHFEGKLDGKKSKVWVVTGPELPVDHIAESAASDARGALRYFYLQWQLKAAQMEQSVSSSVISANGGTIQADYVKSLQRGSELLFQVVNEDRLWPEFQQA